MARDAAVGGWGGREGGRSRQPPIHVRAMQLEALRWEGTGVRMRAAHGRPAPPALGLTMRSCWCRLPNPLPPLPTELPPPAGRGRGDEPPPSTGPKPAWPAGLQSSAEGCRLPSAEGGTVSGRAGAPGHCPSHPGRAPTHLPCRTGLSRRCWGSSQKGRGRRPCCSRHLSWGSTPAGREASALRQAGPGGPGLTYPRSAGSRQVLPSHRKAIYPPSQLPPAQNSLSLLNPANSYGSLKAQPGHPGPFFLPAAPARTTQIRGPQSQDPGRPSAWAAPGQGTQRAPGTSANSNQLAPPGAEGWVWGESGDQRVTSASVPEQAECVLVGRGGPRALSAPGNGWGFR